MPTKFFSFFLCFSLIFEQSVFAQTASLNLSAYLNHSPKPALSDTFRPLHLRYISYDSQANDFKLLLDKGDFFNQKTEKPKNEKTSEFPNSPAPKLQNPETPELKKATQELMKYFFIGLILPNDKFWVNLRPDSPDDILDPLLEKTDIGRILLEADVQLKKDTSGLTSPQTKEGKAYWDKLYKKAGELFGTENTTIPTLTRPWIVPNEIIIREAPDNAYIYKATLKVMLEEDYLNLLPHPRGAEMVYRFSDPRIKELNEYSTRLIRESIIPKLTYAVNTSKRYAPLRQVYYSLILAQWFKKKYGSFGSNRTSGISAPVSNYIDLIDSGNLANLVSSQPYDKQTYFQEYQKSFQDGEYNLQEPVYTPMGQSIRRYVSGGIQIMESISGVTHKIPADKHFFQRLKLPLATFLAAVTIVWPLAHAEMKKPYARIIEDSVSNPSMTKPEDESFRRDKEELGDIVNGMQRSSDIIIEPNALLGFEGNDFYESIKPRRGDFSPLLKLFKYAKERWGLASIEEKRKIFLEKIIVLKGIDLKRQDNLLEDEEIELLIDVMYEILSDPALNMTVACDPKFTVDLEGLDGYYQGLVDRVIDPFISYKYDFFLSYFLERLNDRESDSREQQLKYYSLLSYWFSGIKKGFSVPQNKEYYFKALLTFARKNPQVAVPYLFNAFWGQHTKIVYNNFSDVLRANYRNEWNEGLLYSIPETNGMKDMKNRWEESMQEIKEIIAECFNGNMTEFFLTILRDDFPWTENEYFFETFVIFNREEITKIVIPAMLQKLVKGEKLSEKMSLSAIGKLARVLNQYPNKNYMPKDTFQMLLEKTVLLKTPEAYWALFKAISGNSGNDWKYVYNGERRLMELGVTDNILQEIFYGLKNLFNDDSAFYPSNNPSLSIDLLELLGLVADELARRGLTDKETRFYSYLHYLTLRMPSETKDLQNYFSVDMVIDCFFVLPAYFVDDKEIANLTPYEQLALNLSILQGLKSKNESLTYERALNNAKSLIGQWRQHANDVILDQNTILFVLTQYGDSIINPKIIEQSALSRGVMKDNIHILGAKGEAFQHILNQMKTLLSESSNKDLKPTVWMHGHGTVEGNSGKVRVGGEQIEYGKLIEMINILPDGSVGVFDACHSDISVETMLQDSKINKKITVITTTKGNNVGIASGRIGREKGSVLAAMVYNKGNPLPLRNKDIHRISERLLKNTLVGGVTVIPDALLAAGIENVRLHQSSMLTVYYFHSETGEWVKVSMASDSMNRKKAPSASSAVIDEKMQQCIDKMAKAIFDPKTGKLVDNLIIKDMPPGITIEKLTGGNRGSPVYKLSAKDNDIVFKFFPLTPESLFEVELEGLKRGETHPLFQQLITSKKYVDMPVGCIITKFIPGKSFSVDTASWGLVEYQDKLKMYSDTLKKEFEDIPPEHWEQLVLMYSQADILRITIDANPANLKYDKTKGFTALDYFPTGKGIGFHHSLDDDEIIYKLTGIPKHKFGENNELVDLIKNNIGKAKKTTSKKFKTGGIDLSRINKSIRTESVASPGAGGLSSPVDVDFDVNDELIQLQKLLNAKIIPSADRLNRYARAACASLASSPESADSALSLVAETFRLQEERAVPALPELKSLAAWLE